MSTPARIFFPLAMRRVVTVRSVLPDASELRTRWVAPSSMYSSSSNETDSDRHARGLATLIASSRSHGSAVRRAPVTRSVPSRGEAISPPPSAWNAAAHIDAHVPHRQVLVETIDARTGQTRQVPISQEEAAWLLREPAARSVKAKPATGALGVIAAFISGQPNRRSDAERLPGDRERRVAEARDEFERRQVVIMIGTGLVIVVAVVLLQAGWL